MQNIFLLTNEFTELMALAIKKYENINTSEIVITYDSEKYLPRYCKNLQIKSIAATAPILSNPTIYNIDKKLKSSKKFIKKLSGGMEYILYLPYLNETNKILFTKQCKEIRIYEEGFEAVDAYYDAERSPIDRLIKYKFKHILKVALVTRNINSIRFYFENHKQRKNIISKAYKYTNIAYRRISGNILQVSIKSELDDVVSKLEVNYSKLNSNSNYIVILSELFLLDYDMESVIDYLSEMKREVFYKGRTKDKEDAFLKAQRSIPNLQRFPEQKDLIVELKNGNVYLIVAGISSLLLYAKQMGVNTYVCKAKTQGLKFSQNRMIKFMSEVGE